MKIRFKIIFFFAMLLSASGLYAAVPGFTYGIEWGGGATFYENHVVAYRNLVEPHYVIADDGHGFCFVPCAFIYLHAGFRFGPVSTVLLEIGHEGVFKGRRLFPVMVACELAPNGHKSHGMVFEAAAGPGWDDTGSAQPSLIARLGTGYRLVLGSGKDIEFKLSLMGCRDRQQIFDPVTSSSVPDDMIMKNRALFGALRFGISLNF